MSDMPSCVFRFAQAVTCVVCFFQARLRSRWHEFLCGGLAGVAMSWYLQGCGYATAFGEPGLRHRCSVPFRMLMRQIGDADARQNRCTPDRAQAGCARGGTVCKRLMYRGKIRRHAYRRRGRWHTLIKRRHAELP
jgi:hypothetical protein